MTKHVKLINIGNSTGVILPKEELTRLGLVSGDQVNLERTPDGVSLTKADEEFERQMAVARDVMVRWRGALRELAK